MIDLIINAPQSPIIGYVFKYPIRYYGLIMAFVFFLGVVLAYLLFRFKKSKDYADTFLDYSPLVIFVAIIGARLFYVLGSLEFYIARPSEIFLINHGGLSIYGAIIFGLLTLLFISKKKNFSFLEHLDMIAVVFPLCQAIGRFGNYFNQEAFGMPANCGIKLFVDVAYRPIESTNVAYYHPTFLYESVLDLIIFSILLGVFLKNKNLKNGIISCVYLILYSITRFFIEAIRIDSVLNFFGIPIAQWISLFVFIFSIIGIVLILRNKKAMH